MTELLNAVNAAQAPAVEAQAQDVGPAQGGTPGCAAETSPGQSSNLGGDGFCGGPGGPGEAAPPPERPVQTPEENARFAQVRRCAQRMEQLLGQMEELSRQAGGLLPGLPPPGGGPDGEPGPDLQELELQRALLNHPLTAEAEARTLRYRELAHLRVFEDDLREVQRAFPEEKIGSLEELGDAFFALRQQGVDTQTACAAALRLRGGAPLPPQMGAVGRTEQPSREYYTPAEVDRLTEKDLRDPAVMAAVRQSMTRWKRH